MNKINCYYCNKSISKNYYKKHLDTKIHKKKMDIETNKSLDIVGKDIMDIINGYVLDIEEYENMDKLDKLLDNENIDWINFMIWYDYDGLYQRYWDTKMDMGLEDYIIEIDDNLDNNMDREEIIKEYEDMVDRDWIEVNRGYLGVRTILKKKGLYQGEHIDRILEYCNENGLY